MITVEHLSKKYIENGIETNILKDVNCHIDKGEVISIIGPSGSGKSTLLRCLNRLETPDSGSIMVDGVDIYDKNINVNKIRQKIGMVFQNFNLFEHLNVLENVAFGPIEVLGMSKHEAEEKALELLRLVGMAERADRMPQTLSGGQKQRVAIARCLAVNPEVILFDEPTSALDPINVMEVISTIKRLAQKGMTMIIVTHKMFFAREISSRILFLKDGAILEEGTPEQIFENPKYPETRAFVYRMQSVIFHINSHDYDLYEINSTIFFFCASYVLDKKYITLQLIVEEMLTNILPFSGPIHISVNYNSSKHLLVMNFEQENFKDSLLKRPDVDELSLMLVEGMCTEIKEEETENGKKVEMILK